MKDVAFDNTFGNYYNNNDLLQNVDLCLLIQFNGTQTFLYNTIQPRSANYA
jgi:hypothetical protein